MLLLCLALSHHHLRCPSSIHTPRAKDVLFKVPGIRGIQLAVNKRVSLGELVVGMGGCCILGSRKMVLLHLGCSIGVRGNRFSLRQITKLQERGKLSGRSMLERLSVFSSCVSGCNDLCRCWLSYNNAKVIISEG